MRLTSGSTDDRLTNAPAILCIDDEPDAIQIRKLLLESEGYKVLDASTGEEGLRLFKAHTIHAVVVDYWMSGMNGLAVAREIRKLSPAIPIIVLSGFSELPGEAVGIADRWILKGRSAQVLLDAIADLTQGKSQQ
ncbi:MAG: response regulator [Candidatus Acidiferrales bacterium]